jgi:Tfp pilus assembly protein PilP
MNFVTTVTILSSVIYHVKRYASIHDPLPFQRRPQTHTEQNPLRRRSADTPVQIALTHLKANANFYPLAAQKRAFLMGFQVHNLALPGTVAPPPRPRQ